MQAFVRFFGRGKLSSTIVSTVTLILRVFHGQYPVRILSMLVFVLYLGFFMDQITEAQWFQDVDNLALSQKRKGVVKNYIHKILERGGLVIIDIRHMAALIGINDDLLDRMIVHPDRYYRTFKIPKRQGGEREISAPYPALMKVQRWIYDNILLPTTLLPDSVTGFIPGKSILHNAMPHIGSQYVLKMDIKDFFPSISIDRVIMVFRGLGYHHRLSYALAALCCCNGSLPQGAPTSPILSSIIAKRLDKRIMGFVEKKGLHYTRYADDITVSGDEIKLSHIRFIERLIIDEGFTPNPTKTQLLGPGVKKVITGVSISSGKATIPKNMKRKIRQESYYIERYGLKGHLKHEGIKDPVFPIRLQGKIAYWKSVEPKNEQLQEMFSSLRGAIRRPRIKWLTSLKKVFYYKNNGNA